MSNADEILSTILERTIVERLLLAITMAGYRIQVDEGPILQESLTNISRSFSAIFYESETTDIYLNLYSKDTEKEYGGAIEHIGWIRLQEGNGEDIIIDYSSTLTDLLHPIEEFAKLFYEDFDNSAHGKLRISIPLAYQI